MQCFIKNLLGAESLTRQDSNSCAVFPPIVRSLAGSTVFIILVAILSHLIRT